MLNKSIADVGWGMFQNILNIRSVIDISTEIGELIVEQFHDVKWIHNVHRIGKIAFYGTDVCRS